MRLVDVVSFFIDPTPVTNAEFTRFVMETGHVTVAETPPYVPGLSHDRGAVGKPGSAVFVPLRPGQRADAPGRWWRYVIGANWRRPAGPGSSVERIMDHPVVHVAHGDAEAYATWAGKRLPSEVEWEYAARGGLDGTDYAWGDEFEPAGRPLANYWSGEFPFVTKGRARSGVRTTPVMQYPPNGYGLYDMIGNVWELTGDDYEERSALPANECCHRGETHVRNARKSRQFVIKGGSHLCAPNYCIRYRPAARFAQDVDTSTSHVGFRCVADAS